MSLCSALQAKTNYLRRNVWKVELDTELWILSRGDACAFMPQQFTAAAMLQLVLLLSAVPAQYLISKWTSSTSAQRFHATSRLLRIWKEWRASYLNGTAWMDWAHQQISQVSSLLGFEAEVEEAKKTAVIESMLDDNEEGFFGASKTARSPRPPYVFLRVGDVVMERRGNMIGVVVSWDSELRAPPEWIERIYSSHEGPKVEKTPHYKVLFSGPTSTSVFVGYLPQTQLERIQGMRPDIATLENYFTHFDGERFVMQPWLREIYPEDDEDVY